MGLIVDTLRAAILRSSVQNSDQKKYFGIQMVL